MHARHLQRFPSAVLLLPLACAALGSCGSKQSERPSPGFLQDGAARTDDDPTPDAETILREDPPGPTFEVDFASGSTSGRWSFYGIDGEPVRVQDGLRFESTGSARVVWETTIEGPATTHLAVRLASVPERSSARFVRVHWKPEGEEGFALSHSRAASLPLRALENGELLFSVARQPSWNTRLSALSFTFDVEGSVVLAGVRGLNLAPSIARHIEREWNAPDRYVPAAVEIQRMRRTALRVGPASALSQSLLVQPGDALDFGFALHPVSSHLPGSRTRFSVTVQAPGAGAAEELAHFEVPSETYPRLAGWHDARVSLERFAGQEIELRLCTAALSEGPTTAIPLWAEPRLVRPDTPLEGPNLVLVSIDTLRADHLESYGYRHATAPNIERLAEQGVRFRHCLSHAPSTLPSHGALFTGIPAHANRMYGSEGLRLAGSSETLAETLRTAGFATAGFVGGGYFDPNYGLSQGFDTYAYAATGLSVDNYSDVSVGVERTLGWLERNQDRRFFLFLHTYEVHTPFTPRPDHLDGLLEPGVRPPRATSHIETNARTGPLEAPTFEGWRAYFESPEEDESFRPEAVQRMVASYDSEIRATDEEIARVLTALDELGLSDETLVIFTSDHGEAFLDHGRTGHGHLYEHNLHVPLVMRLSGRLPAGLVVEDSVQLADVMPTCLDLLGVEAPAQTRGVSLVPHVIEGAPLPHRAIVSYDVASGLSYLTPDDRKLIVNVFAKHPSAGRRELYDLRSDPLEESDLYGTLDAEAVRELDARLSQVFAELPGTHVVLRAEQRVRFTGRLSLEQSPVPLPQQLRCFPLEPGWIEYDEQQRAAVATGELTDWQLYLQRGGGRLRLEGELSGADGRVAKVAEALELDELSGQAPRSWEIRDSEGRPLARLHALLVDPGGEEEQGAGPSEETLEQLRQLGYL